MGDTWLVASMDHFLGDIGCEELPLQPVDKAFESQVV